MGGRRLLMTQLKCLELLFYVVILYLLGADFDEEGNPNYDSAKAMLVTFLLNNHLSDEDNGMALAWEQKFLEIVQSFNESNPYINISYSSEVCTSTLVSSG